MMLPFMSHSRNWRQIFKHTSNRLLLLGAGVILLLYILTRFYQLGEIPAGITWDEAAIGYNGYAVFTTRRDEWLTRLPISFRSFGDYKAPLAIYLNGPFTALLGMKPWVVRLPFVLLSFLALAGVAGMIFEIWHAHRYRWVLSLGAATLLTTSPWHFHFSRVGFESGMALAFYTFGLWQLLRSLRLLAGERIRLPLVTSLFLAAGSLVAALYTYHSAKVVIPVVLLGVVVVAHRRLLKHWRVVLPVAAISALALYPLLTDSLRGEGLQRADVLVFSQVEGGGQLLQVLWHNLLTHLTPSFLIFGEIDSLRHGTGVWGILLPTSLLLAIVSLLALLPTTLFKERLKKLENVRRPVLLGLGLTLAGLTPAVMANTVPHPNRALLALPGWIILVVVGLLVIWQILAHWKKTASLAGSKGEQRLVAKSVLGTIGLIHFLLFTMFVNYYFTQYPQTAVEAFHEGYLEAARLATQYERGALGDQPPEKILFTSEYGQPYIYALFAGKTNPIWYRGGSLNTYEFTDRITVGDLERPNILIVAGPTMGIPQERADHVIYGSDGSVRFVIVKTPPKE